MRSLAKPGQLTSSVFSDPSNPPTDWCDTAFLVPHEWLRREMAALVTSCDALPTDTNDDDNNAWKATYFAQWITDFFIVAFKMHHTNEDDIYVPMMKEQGCQGIGEKKISKDHQALLQQINELEQVAKSIQKAEGKDCNEAISQLKSLVSAFVHEMLDHLKEEEMTLPQALKAHVPKKAHDEAVGKIVQAGGLGGLHIELPGILAAAQEWATDEHYQEMLLEIPPPVVQLAHDIFIPNYRSYHCAMRDAPTMEKKPVLVQIPFDPSMLPAPPAAEDIEE
ncbi:hypothetical protein ACA910_010366 [Epithemia clementina (nom. ined.)]